MSWPEILLGWSVFLIFYTYVGYPLLLLGIAAFASKKRRKDNNHVPSVSMLIAAYNEDAVIEEKLRNCLALDYVSDKLEIIIGSDGSQDRTNEIVQKYTGNRIRLVPFSMRRGKAAILNNLAQLAQGHVLVFSDANTMYRPDAIARLVPHFADARVGGVCGRLILLNQNGNDEAEGERLYWNYENRLKYLEGRIKTVFGANGAIYAIRRELFQSLPCDKAVMDDFLIPLSVVQRGYDIVYDKDAVGWEFTAPDLQAEFRRKVRIGAANFHGIREILPLLSPFKGFVAFGLWSHKIIRWLVPFLLIAAFVANLWLWGTTLYETLLVVQILFYGLALIAYVLDRFNIHVPWLIYPCYFVATNLALLVGFCKFILRAQDPAWARVKR